MIAECEGEVAMGRLIGFAVLVAALMLGACTDGAESGESTTSTTGPASASTTQALASTTSADSADPADPATKILFVGDGLTLVEGGLKNQLRELAASATPPLIVETEESAMKGATLETLWSYSSTPKMIANGEYDIVVLQGNVIWAGVDGFQQHVRNFVEATRETGAEPVLFMTWSTDLAAVDEMAQIHSDIAAELDIAVAPIGLAFQRASEERPEIDLLVLSKQYQSAHGAYLVVNVVYLTVFGTEHPVTLTYLPEGITEEEAMFLQRIARETVSEYTANQTS
jgi:hypothetical protein